MTTDVTVDVHLAPDDRARALEADVRAGLTASPKTLPPKWFYDDRGQRAVRRDHPPARVLPDPHRARDPARRTPRDVADAHQGRHARRARLGHLGEDPHPARRVARRGHAAIASCRST